MSKLFIAIASGGQWSDHWTTNMAVSPNKFSLEKLIEDAKAERIKFDTEQALILKFREEFKERHPRKITSLIYPERIGWPTGLKEKEITIEMRNERNSIVDKQKEYAIDQKKLDEEWEDLWVEIANKFCKDNNIKAEDYYLRHFYPEHRDEVYYDIKEIDFIE